MLDLRISEFAQTLAEARPRILGDRAICAALAASDFGRKQPGSTDAQAAAAALTQLVGDAKTSLRLINGHLRPGARVLEIGGGIGLTHFWLRRLGVEATALEPALTGHAGYFQLGERLLGLLGTNTDRWLPLRAEDAPQLGQAFDLIFSNNVLEHLDDLPEALEAMRKCLLPGGLMRHQCPNYLFPYEPHYGIPLPPFKPQWATWMRRDLSQSPLWQSLNFISSPLLLRLCQGLGLSVQFDRDHLYRTVRRFEDEPAFREKHPLLARLFWALGRFGALPLLRAFPPMLATPMQVTLRPISEQVQSQ